MHTSDRRTTAAGGVLVLLAATAVSLPLTGAATAAPLSRCAPVENVAPVLDSLTIGPRVVDARSASQQVQVTAEAHDLGGPGPRTGVRSVELYLTNGRHVVMAWTGGHTWVGSTTVPRWSKPGPLAVRYAFLSDRADFPDRTLSDDGGQFDVLYSPGGQHSWAEVAGNRTVEVLSTRDDTLPRITDVDLSPRKVDTRAGARYVYATARAFDGVSGVRDGWMRLYPETPDRSGAVTVHLRPLPGRHGLMRGRFGVPRRVGREPWFVQSVIVRDHAGRRRTLSGSDLRAAGWPDRLRVVGAPVAPAGRTVVRSVRVDRSSIDVRNGDRAVTYRIRATNRIGLVREVGLWLPFSAGVRGEIRPRLVSGDRHDGVWSARVVVDGCRSQGGILSPTVTARDWAGEDQEQGPSTRVLAGDNSDPTYDGSTVVDGRVVVVFSEDVDGISDASVSVRLATVSGEVPGAWSCATVDGGPTPCLTGRTRTATFTPDLAAPVGSTYGVVVNPPGHLEVTDAAGNPAVRQSH